MATHKYSQHDGYDKFRTTDSEGNTEHSGKAEYDSDGSLSRLSLISPSSSHEGYHYHEWLNKKEDGDYEYGYGEHEDHS